MNNVIKIFLFACLLCISRYGGIAQTVSGILTDKRSAVPVAYATASLQDTTGKPVAGMMTGETGTFLLGPVKPGKYILECRFVGYEPLTRQLQLSEGQNLMLGNLPLLPDAKLLDEVAITSQKSTLILLPDKKVFEVGKDLLSQNGSVSDVLNSIPSVTVSPQGQISLRGNQGVTVLINGRRSGLVQGNALEQLQAGQVERIEVISSPSSRYDASGTAGIINIILKKNKKTGFNGQLQAMAGTPNDTRLNPSLNYKSDKFNFFSTLGMRKSDYDGKYSTDLVTGNTTLAMRQNEDRHDDGKMLYAGMDYQISEKRTMTTAYLWNGTHDHDRTALNYDYRRIKTDSVLQRSGESWERRNYHQLEYNYTQLFSHPKQKWTIDFQYDWWNSNKNWQLETSRTFPALRQYPAIRTNNKDANRDLLIQSDWVQPLGKNVIIEAGVKTESRSVSYHFLAEQQTDNDHAIYQNLNNGIRYQEQIQGAYAQLTNKAGNLNYLAGIRIETTSIRINHTNTEHSEKKDYTHLFPSLHLDYSMNETITIQAHYSTRIRRPSLYQLSPYPELTDLNSLNTGNPDLRPAYAPVYELGFLKRTATFTLNPSLFYQYLSSPVADYTYRDASGIFISLPVNISNENRLGVEVNMVYNPVPPLQLNADFTTYRFRQSGKYNGFDFAHSGSSSNGRLTAQVQFPHGLSILGRYYYNGPNATAQTRVRAMHWADLSFGKKLLNDLLSITADVTNVFDTRRYRTIITGQDYTLSAMDRFNGARYRLSMTYKIANDAPVREAKAGNRN